MSGVRVALVTVLAAAPLPAQTPGPAGLPDRLPVSTAVAPDTVTVGDRFVSVLRVHAPPGARVTFRGIAASDSLQPVDTVRVIEASAANGATAEYVLVAWISEAALHAEATVRVELGDTVARTYAVPLALPVVRSVLPAEGTDLQPRPGRGVRPFAPGTPWWIWLSALLALTLLLGLAARSLRRRQAPPAAPADHRAAAVAELERIRGSDLAPHAMYTAAARVLRRYLAAVNARWGEEWTTTELSARLLADEHRPAEARDLLRLLERADRVKFAGEIPTPVDAQEFTASVRAWIDSFPAAERIEVRSGEAA